MPGETADGSLNQLWSKWAIVSFWITVENPELIHAATSPQPNPLWELTGDAFIRPRRAHRQFSAYLLREVGERLIVCRM